MEVCGRGAAQCGPSVVETAIRIRYVCPVWDATHSIKPPAGHGMRVTLVSSHEAEIVTLNMKFEPIPRPVLPFHAVWAKKRKSNSRALPGLGPDSGSPRAMFRLTFAKARSMPMNRRVTMARRASRVRPMNPFSRPPPELATRANSRIPQHS